MTITEEFESLRNNPYQDLLGAEGALQSTLLVFRLKFCFETMTGSFHLFGTSVEKSYHGGSNVNLAEVVYFRKSQTLAKLSK